MLSGAFNEMGGLHHSSVLERSLVDHLIPFLPLTRSHVRECVLASAGDRVLTEDDINKILDQMSYWPEGENLYSSTGCKRVDQKVALYLEQMYDDI